MEKSAYAILALVVFTSFALAVSAATEEEAFKNAQGKNLGPLPAIPCPPPPAPADPAPAGSCGFWSKKPPATLPDILTFLTPLLDIFSSAGSSGASSGAIASIFGSKTTLHQGLTSTRSDGYGSLLRQGSAAILNSYASRAYPFTPLQVKASFRGALASQQAAATQAAKFENANLAYGARN